jgi:IS5 family transposase
MLEALAEGQILLADRAYDSDALRQSLDERGAWANIKPIPGPRTSRPSAPISTATEISSSASSTKSSITALSRRAMTNAPTIFSPASSRFHQNLDAS